MAAVNCLVANILQNICVQQKKVTLLEQLEASYLNNTLV